LTLTVHVLLILLPAPPLFLLVTLASFPILIWLAITTLLLVQSSLLVLLLSLLFPALLSFLIIALLLLTSFFPTLLLSLLLFVSALRLLRRLFITAALTFRTSLLPFALVLIIAPSSPLRANQTGHCQRKNHS